MGNILSSIWRLISKIFSSILKWLGDIFGDWFLIILILVAIWFAPVIATWLVSVGAPTFVVTIFETIAIATPYLQSAAAWLWEGGSSLVSSAWSAYTGLSTGTQAAVALGAAAMIAPEETEALLSDAAGLLATGAGAIAGALLGNPVGLAVAAGLVWFLFLRKKEPEIVVQQPMEGSRNGQNPAVA